jgi:hypothetical protein
MLRDGSSLHHYVRILTAQSTIIGTV